MVVLWRFRESGTLYILVCLEYMLFTFRQIQRDLGFLLPEMMCESLVLIMVLSVYILNM